MPSQSTSTAAKRPAPITHLVDSTVLSAMRYDPERHELTLTFRDGHGTYRYEQVGPEVWEALLAAPSKGTFLNQVLKPLNLPYHRLRRA